MTNDLTTLSGALLEMKDQLIYELGQKGVTASYDSSTGLLGLIGEISNIQTGGGSCYHIEFTEDSYVAVNNVATVTVYLQENYAPKTSATVTFTGGSSTVTATTDSNGIATANVPVSSATTLTATYSNVSDTCTVTTSSVIYQPALDGTETKKQISGTTTISNGVMSGGASYLTGGWDNTGNWKCTFDAYISNDGSAVGIYGHNETQRDKNMVKITGNYHHNITAYTNGSSVSSASTSNVPQNTWFTIILTKNGTTLTCEMNNNSYTVTWGQLTTLSEVHIGLDTWGNTAKIRNIKVEPL